MIDFQSEISSLRKHEEFFTRPRLQCIVNHLYIPKLKAKVFCSSMYAGETMENYN